MFRHRFVPSNLDHRLLLCDAEASSFPRESSRPGADAKGLPLRTAAMLIPKKNRKEVYKYLFQGPHRSLILLRRPLSAGSPLAICSVGSITLLFTTFSI